MVPLAYHADGASDSIMWCNTERWWGPSWSWRWINDVGFIGTITYTYIVTMTSFWAKHISTVSFSEEAWRNTPLRFIFVKRCFFCTNHADGDTAYSVKHIVSWPLVMHESENSHRQLFSNINIETDAFLVLPGDWNVPTHNYTYSQGSWEQHRYCHHANAADGCDTMWFLHQLKHASSFSDRHTIIEITRQCWQFPYKPSEVTGSFRSSVSLPWSTRRGK